LKRALQLTSVIFLTILFLGLFLWNSNLHDVWRIMRSMNAGWFAVGLAVNFSALIFRTIRWRTLIDPENPPPLYPTFFATTVGYMLSTVLPIRASDVARPALLSRRTSVRFSGALGTVLTERILDLFSLLLLFVYFVVAHWSGFSKHPSFAIMKSAAVAAGVVLGALVALILGLFFFRPAVRRLHEWLARFVPRRFRPAWMNFFDAFAESLQLSAKPRALAIVLLCTAGIWAALTSQFWFVTKALHTPLPFDSSFFVTGVTTVGLAVPTPGGVGGFHKACQLVLTTFYNFSIDSSVAVALIFHAVGTLPVLVTGLALFAREGLHWSDFTKA
jgi:uncharacterized protein (TIRG00374 family)